MNLHGISRYIVSWRTSLLTWVNERSIQDNPAVSHTELSDVSGQVEEETPLENGRWGRAVEFKEEWCQSSQVWKQTLQGLLATLWF